ncbi:MAG: undecaprenyl-diphosphate phosphatase [Planctomycetota bacterium]
MTDLINATVFGIVQGLTEFLPVSSSGHLEIAKYLLGDDKISEQSMLMTVLLHFATALSTVVVFWKEIGQILKGLFEFRWNEQTAFSLKIVVSMIPAVFVGLMFEEELEALFNKRLVLVGLMLLVTGVLLLLADRAKKTEKSVRLTDAILVGISQAIAILPGISRSGATISTSVLLGIDREKAARFSFLMVIPLIFGKMAKMLLDAYRANEPFAEPGEALPLTVGFFAAFFTGLLACTWMIRLVKASKLTYFSIYCFVVAAIVIFIGLKFQ